MTTNIVTTDAMQSFREKVLAKVRSDIADMLPPEAIDALVQEAVKQTFFEPREVRDHWNRPVRETPSWFVEEVTKAAEPLLKEAVNRALVEHKDAIDRAIAEYLTPQNLTLVAVRAVSDTIGNAIRELSYSIQNFKENP